MEDKRIENLSELIANDDLCRFFSVAKSYLNDHPVYASLRDRIEDVEYNYKMMLGCFLDGMDDPKRTEIFNEITAFAYKTYEDLRFNEKIRNTPTLLAAKQRADSIDLLQIESLAMGHEDDMELYNNLFSAVLVSWQWSVTMRETFYMFLHAPESEPKLVALLISAMTLSCLLSFDANKVECLIRLYKTLDDRPFLKERAFVGWVLALSHIPDIAKKEQEVWLEELLRSDAVRDDLVELQEQIIFCLNAEKESSELDAEKGLPLMPPFVIGDALQSPSLEEILHPEQDEKQEQKLEKYMAKMLKKQKEGCDVYFNSFSQMKSFAFFHRLSNWFLPYDSSHPALQPLRDALDGSDKFVTSLASQSPFCESDKYSFAFAIELSLKNSLAPLKSFMKEGGMFSIGSMKIENVDKNTLVRRQYLQDLYRFFKVSSFASIFDNPFVDEEGSKAYFLATWSVDDPKLLHQERLRVCEFLCKRKDYRRLGVFASRVSGMEDDKGIMYYVIYLMNYAHSYHEATMLLAMLKVNEVDTRRISKALIKCFMELEMYDGAVDELRKLLEEKKTDGYQLKLAYCLLKMDQVDEAMDILYELNYKAPDNVDVLRSLAWGNVLRDKYDDAINTYDKIQGMVKEDDGNYLADDDYNKGLCYWLKKDFKAASSCLKHYMKSAGCTPTDLFDKLNKDFDLLQKHGIKYTELFLMRDCADWDALS